MIDVDVSEVLELAADLDKAGPAAIKLSTEALTKTARELQADIQAAAPVDTGTLAGSYRIAGGAGWRIVYSELRYAGFVEFGTVDTAPQPHAWPAARQAEATLYAAFHDIDPLP